MIKYENECCGCATSNYPCLGRECPNRNVPRLYCDKCGEEVDSLREYEGEQWCDDCILNEFDMIDVE